MKIYPLGRKEQSKDVTYGAVYLLYDAASCITGIDLVIDGGVTLII